jgi:hypothetical protein
MGLWFSGATIVDNNAGRLWSYELPGGSKIIVVADWVGGVMDRIVSRLYVGASDKPEAMSESQVVLWRREGGELPCVLEAAVFPASAVPA